MATISVGDAVGEGFSLIRRHPAAVAIWALILLVTLGARIAISIPVYAAFFGAFMQSVRSGSTSAPNFAALAPQLQQAQAVGFLFSLVQLLVNAVLACAIFRAVLRPAESRLAYMRVGAAELFLAIFTIGAVIAFVIGAVIVAIPIGIVAALIGMGSPAAFGAFAFVAMLGVMFLVVYLALRLSLLGPMMVDEGQFRLGEAWALTRGKVGSLFLIALLLVVILIVAEVVVGGTTVGVFIASIGGFSGAKGFFQAPQAQILARLAPVMAVGGLGWLALVVCMLPVINAPWARAYRSLKQSDVAATFS